MRSEFGFLKHLKEHFNLSRVGDDSAVFPKDDKHDYLITSDLIVEGIDFRLDWTTPKFIGHKVLAVSISDIAAMGGTPAYSLLSIGVPERIWNSDFLDEFYKGYLGFAERVNEDLPGRPGIKVELIGGDISRTENEIAFDSTVIGFVEKGKAVFRSGANPGDKIFVTGELGTSAYGLELLKQGYRYGDPAEGERHVWLNTLEGDSILYHLQGPQFTQIPYPGLPSAMIDISDGLSSDLQHLCEASGVGARIYAEKVPAFVRDSLNGISKAELLELALHGGEDFELLFTADPKELLNVPDFFCQPIGEITEHVGTIELITDGISSPLKPEGFTHFSEKSSSCVE